MGSTITIARTREDVEALRPLWSRLEVRNMDADIDFFLAVVGSDPDVVAPHVVMVERPDAPPLLVVARLSRRPFPLKVGYRTLLAPQAMTAVIAFDGFLGASSADDVRVALDALVSTMRTAGIDVVMAQKIDESGPVDQVLASTGGSWQRARVGSFRLWSATLPDSWEALLAARSSKSRRQLRYDDSKLRKKYGDRLVVRELHDEEHAPRRQEDMDRVARTSYQHGLGVSVFRDPVQRALIDLADRRGWLRVWMLYVDERPVAFWWGIAYDGVMTVMSPGFDPQFGSDRVGYFTLRRMLEALCADADVTSISFGPGDAEYKERFGTESIVVTDVFLFRRGLRALGVNGVVRAGRRADDWGRRALAAVGSRDELRRRLRRAATRGTDASS